MYELPVKNKFLKKILGKNWTVLEGRTFIFWMFYGKKMEKQLFRKKDYLILKVGFVFIVMFL